MIAGATIAEARECLAQHFTQTPLLHASALSSPGRGLYLKNETLLPTGSFKVRGAIYALERHLAAQAIGEVVAASTGNHGAAVAYAASLLGVPARIFVPLGSNPVKTARIREAGAELVETGRDLSEAIDAADGYAAATGAFFLHDASNPDIPAGTATIGAELGEQLPGVEAVYVPTGDTALIRGVASALRQTALPVHIVGVVAANAPAYSLSWNAGRVVETSSANTAADGLAVRRPLAANVSDIRRLVDDVVEVSEAEMFDAIARLYQSEKIVAEPSGAAALAAALRSRDRHCSVVALVTGGNIAPALRKQVLGF